VARQLNKVRGRDSNDPAGCRIGTQSFAPGDTLSLDGHSGNVYAGKLEVVVEKPTRYLEEIQRLRNEKLAQRQDHDSCSAIPGR